MRIEGELSKSFALGVGVTGMHYVIMIIKIFVWMVLQYEANGR